MSTVEVEQALEILATTATALNKDEPQHAAHNAGVLELAALMLGVPVLDPRLEIIFNVNPSAKPAPTSWPAGRRLAYLGTGYMEKHGHACVTTSGSREEVPGGGLVNRVYFEEERDRVWVLPSRDLYDALKEEPWFTYPIGTPVVCTHKDVKNGKLCRVVDYVRDTRQHKVMFEGTEEYLYLFDSQMREPTEAEREAWGVE